MAPGPSAQTDQKVLERISADLTARFKGVFAPETVEHYVFESYTALARSARIRAYLTVLTEHFAKDRLTALAQSTGAAPKDVPEVLFVCVQNSGRSQLAAAYLRHTAGPAVHVRTAGSAPAAEVDPAVAELITARGSDRAEDYPKPLTDDVVRGADYVITMGCGDACPIYPGKRYLDWDVKDPATAPDRLEAIAAQITAEVDALLAAIRTEKAEGATT
ncbi:arsenate-mycothiol transferase ArsC [Sinomonas atrocyanea]